MTLSITLVRPAGDFLARLAMPLFCPVPLVDPARPGALPAGRSPRPARTTSLGRGQPDRPPERNPNYAGDRPRRSGADRHHGRTSRPRRRSRSSTAGNSTTCRRLRRPYDAARTRQGELARLYGPASAAARAGHSATSSTRTPMFDMVVFNTRRPLFRDLRLRRAVEYALDRPAIAVAYFDAPAIRAILPGVPGYGPGQPVPAREARPCAPRAVLPADGATGPSS